MKNKKLTICLYLISLLAATSKLCYAQNSLFVGAGIQNFSLIEKDRQTGKQLVKEQGNIPTIIYGLDWPINQQFHFQGQIQQSYGVMPYDGQTQSDIPHQSDTTHFLSQGMASIGFLPIKQSEIYIGIHAQKNVRNVANKNNVYGATETYDELFAKVGLRQQLVATPKQKLYVWGEVYAPLYAQSFVDARTSDDVTLELSKGKAKAWGVDYIYHYNTKTDWFIKVVSFTHHYQESSKANKTFYGQATGSYLYQPPIFFKQQSLYAGLAWHFD
jgi:hypothetical protein